MISYDNEYQAEIEQSTLVFFMTMILFVLIGCQTPKNKLNEEQSEEYHECVFQGGDRDGCWCEAKWRANEKAFDICMEQ